MKEATGELNLTVITVIAIAAIATIFYAFVWPSLKVNIVRNTCEDNITTSTKCANAVCGDCSEGKSLCVPSDGGDKITCPCKS